MAGGNIDRQLQLGQAHIPPGHGLLARRFQYPLPQGLDKADSFGDIDKLQRAYHATRRVVPAHQRLNPRHTASPQVDLWLIM